MMKRSAGEKVFAVFNTIFLLLLCVVFFLPVWHVAMGSISDPLKVAASSGLYLKPLGKPTLGGYRLIMQNSTILRAYGNTLIYVVSSTLFGLVLTILAAYVMSTRGLLFGKTFALFVVFTMIFNGGLVPTFLVVNKLGLIDTRWALIIPGAVSAYNIIIMRTSFSEIPGEMLDAARIDGADEFKILTSIILPVSKAIIAVIVLFYAVQHWNAWFNAAIYLQKSRNLYPLQLTLREIVLQATENSIIADADGQDVMIFRPLIKYATIMISIIPMMIVYPFVQKYFVTGVMIGSVKG
ncbi:MAG: carbohydrate ABC transporter permease [Lachnospiraceae bacterium]|nr:carbohydrate ABC transporter permease [Lachnospiraceae bacterium]MBO7600259.1 carbohydrate ABC transporter permease [Lachnospiraceae bacterium]